MTEHKSKSYARRAIKIVLWMLAGILGMIVLAVVTLQFPQVQRHIAQKVVSSISAKTHTRIEVGSVNIAFTRSVVLKNILVESQQRDTLLSIQTLAVDLNLLGLFSQEIRLNNVLIDSLTAHVTRTLPDSIFNFDFLLNALSPDPTGAEIHRDTSAEQGWEIRLGEMSLNDIRVTYNDDVSGLNLRLQLGTLKATLDKFDIEKDQFHIAELSIENTTASVIQGKETPALESESAEPDIGIGNISLANLQLSYENTVSGERYEIDLGNSNLVADEINLPSHRIALQKVTLENTSVVVARQQQQTMNTLQVAHAERTPWVISLDQVELKGNSIHYDVEGTRRNKGLDPNHLLVTGLTIQAGDIYYSENRMAAKIEHIFLKEQSGLDVRDISGIVTLDSLHAELSAFILETATSRISNDLLLTYPSLSILMNSPGNVHVQATIGESKIGVSDLFLFQRSLPINNRSGASITITARLSGLIKDLRIEEFKLRSGDSTTLDLTGSIRGLPEAATAYYDVDIQRFSSSRADIHALVVDTLVPRSISLPASIRITATFKGTTKNFTASSDIVTSIGSLGGNVTLNSNTRSKPESSRWTTDLTMRDFNVGALLNDTLTFGTISLKASATGTGLNKDDVEAQLNLNVESAVLNGYPYRNFSASGTASPGRFEGKAEIQDSNIAFVFTGTINTSEENPAYKFNLDLKGADLQRLRLTSDDIRIAGMITSDLTGQDINDINGEIEVRNVVIIKNRQRYVIDSLLFVSVNKEKEAHISLESRVFGATFDGTIALGDLPGTLKDHFSRYFTLHDDTSHTGRANGQAFTFQVTLRDPRMITEVFFPQLDRLSAGAIEGNYDSEKKNLNVNAVVATVNYDDFTIDSLRFTIASDADQLKATLRAGSIADSTLHITNLQLTATVEHDSIDVTLQSGGDSTTTKMLLAGVFSSVPHGYQFRFKPDGVILQNTRWTVPADNYLLFGTSQIVAHNIVLRGAGQSLSVNSLDEKSQSAPLEIEFASFSLATCSQLVERHDGLVRGMLDGNIRLRNLDEQMAFTSDLSVRNFSFGQRLVGDIRLRANNLTENTYEVNMDITGNDNDIAMRGRYLNKVGGNEFDLNCDFNRMNLAGIEPFLFGRVRRLSGTMSGELHMTGTMEKPSITGNLEFTNTAFNPTILDSYLRVNNGEIIFDRTGVHFGSFELVDTLGNSASLSGSVLTQDFRDFGYDCRVKIENFLLMNKPASRDALYYGTVFLDSDILVQGDQAKPVIRVQAQLDEGTDLAVVLPESETATQQRRGIVRFVDVKNPANPILSRRKSGAQSTRDSTVTEISGIDLTSNVEVNKESRLRILIDPIAGDSLEIRGEATFSVGVDPSGKLAVTGRYEILEGSYRLSFGEFIRREFAIEKGSSLTWFGSVTEATVDITAIHTVKTSALDLVQDQLVGLSEEERNTYKQELRIQVYLMMDGNLLEPNISFKLDLPPDQRGALGGSIYAKLNEVNGQESELNKQVFALLVLGRFISSDPLAYSNESGLSGVARSSASQILTEQLNRLSQAYITGVSLEVGVESYEDYSTGTAEGRTQLQLALSKQLFDERVSVQVGGNVDLEGQRSQQNSLNNFAGDLKVGYKLTEDGRWQLQVFRQNTYEGAIEGDIVETGVGVVFTIDYDKLFGFTLKPVPTNEEAK